MTTKVTTMKVVTDNAEPNMFPVVVLGTDDGVLLEIDETPMLVFYP